MEAPWVLILQTACRGDEEPPGLWAQAMRHDEAGDASSLKAMRRKKNEAWNNHTELAFLECDVALFPEDLSLSREEFLASVWRLPQQRLHPCGTENLLFFPAMSVSEYRTVLSSCRMQPTEYYPEVLLVKAEISANAKVSRDASQGGDSVVTHVEADIDLANASWSFYEHAHSSSSFFEEVDVDPCLPSEFYKGQFHFENKSDVYILLESLKAKIESDARAVDHIMMFYVAMGTLLLLCLVKLTFFDNVANVSRRKARLTEIHCQTPMLGRPGNSPWLAGFQTPKVSTTALAPWPLQNTIATDGATLGGSTAKQESASPCEALSMEWRRSKEERRRNRRIDLLGPRRLIPPSETKEEGDTVSDTDTKKGDGVQNETISNLARCSSGEESSLAVEKSDPEKIARTLWSFGL